MATGGKPTSFTEDEVSELLDSFLAMGVKPKAHSKEELQAWMKYFCTSTEPSFKEERPLYYSSRKERDVQILPSTPRISTFSGDSTSKTYVAFDVWKFEVEQLLSSDYKDEVIRQSIFKSLRGQAGKIAMRFGHNVAVHHLINKLEGIFGIVEEAQDILAEFYSTHQKESESVADWSCRLEDLLQKTIDSGEVSMAAINDMPRTRFYGGLRPAIKMRSAHKYDAIKDFEELVVNVRRIEHEMIPPST